ncbi:DUF4058 family protein [Anaerolineales bacterium HSG25]|nr:DUF4058 family protein [Anaerolineales bacterium HSG25]
MTKSPFPGMDPYLEAPHIWPDLHNSLMYIFRQQLSPHLAPKYTAELETELIIDEVLPGAPLRTGYADVTITEPTIDAPYTSTAVEVAPAPVQLAVPMQVETRLVSLHIRHRESDQIVTVIELLSPVNKRAGLGRKKYLTKRIDYLSATVHLVEIDLLRAHPRLPFGGDLPAETSYLVMVSPYQNRPTCDAWPLRLADPLPTIPIPLRYPDPAVPLALQTALQTAYHEARYDLRVDYSQSPSAPNLSEADSEWVGALFGDYHFKRGNS